MFPYESGGVGAGCGHGGAVSGFLDGAVHHQLHQLMAPTGYQQQQQQQQMANGLNGHHEQHHQHQLAHGHYQVRESGASSAPFVWTAALRRCRRLLRGRSERAPFDRDFEAFDT
ncbi:hypothetical protein HPB47_028507 [Ixodes persulcatus]|uniref:Uncharacterized protein n=1 Tax=Ixodes persulcatus TaxID=34615 RepID=A0AC60PSZ4_IXOPE|nr:hypothetical protein HPB47_028507 [Ixodes persulcatus]